MSRVTIDIEIDTGDCPTLPVVPSPVDRHPHRFGAPLQPTSNCDALNQIIAIMIFMGQLPSGFTLPPGIDCDTAIAWLAGIITGSASPLMPASP